ncbi:hypothetical protein A200_00500 [Parascardovia denticolens IPLA 20019]|uniref:hypothetical protein n=1 Tax=Parascardovia denticolens TaxID=78258 RepID=UPI000266A940|nr:hypothetical protein [Parascardovia denticolens]EIT88933.1 hypothetical protein A200_00500 [Parascardovia denticolens IPLA 20019]
MKVRMKRGLLRRRSHPFLAVYCRPEDGVDLAAAQWMVLQTLPFLLPSRFEDKGSSCAFFYDLTGRQEVAVDEIVAFPSSVSFPFPFPFMTVVKTFCQLAEACQEHQLPLQYVVWSRQYGPSTRPGRHEGGGPTGEGLGFLYLPVQKDLFTGHSLQSTPWKRLGQWAAVIAGAAGLSQAEGKIASAVEDFRASLARGRRMHPRDLEKVEMDFFALLRGLL